MDRRDRVFNNVQIIKAKEKLLLFSKLISRNKLTYSSFGNISLKLDGQIIIKNRGVNLELASESDFSVISLEDSPSKLKKHALISSEWKMHHLSYLKNPSLGAILHLHPIYISLLDDLDVDLDSDDLEFNYLLKGKIKRVPFYEPGSEKLAVRVASNIDKYPFLVLNKHGIVSAAEDLETVYNYALTAERLAQRLIYLRLLKNLC
ncbi:MAG: class II aldolase/adducin family protein [Candidatus Kaelpia imicola]|nr:class II aldolase/adducin family protein [Candidatus Kaelpia imicola]